MRTLTSIAAEPAYTSWFKSVLDAMACPVLILEPVYDDRDLIDLAVIHANPLALRGGLTAAEGQTLLELRPDLAHRGLLGQASMALSTGQPSQASPAPVGPVGQEPRAQMTRLGAALVLSWPLTD